MREQIGYSRLPPGLHGAGGPRCTEAGQATPEIGPRDLIRMQIIAHPAPTRQTPHPYTPASPGSIPACDRPPRDIFPVHLTFGECLVSLLERIARVCYAPCSRATASAGPKPVPRRRNGRSRVGVGKKVAPGCGWLHFFREVWICATAAASPPDRSSFPLRSVPQPGCDPVAADEPP